MFSLPPADLGFIEESIHNLKRSILESFEDVAKPVPVNLATPDVIIVSLERLFPALAHYEMYDTSGSIKEYTEFSDVQDINVLADYGLQLVADLTYWTKLLDLPSTHDEMHRIGLALGLWLAQHGAEISLLEPIVDNLTFVVGDLTKQADLEQAYRAASQIMDAVNLMLIVQEGTKPNTAWRKLLLQRATIAIRTQRPLLMEYAFQCLMEFIPEDTADFFQDEIAQLSAKQYSEAVLTIIKKYFKNCCVVRTLH